jgi:hypothetical protein
VVIKAVLRLLSRCRPTGSANGREMHMAARVIVALMTAVLGIGLMGTAVAAGSPSEPAVLREEDATEVVVAYDDDDDGQGGNTGNTGRSFKSGTGNSNDGTNSRVTGVSKDKDRSRDDLTKDWSKDGPGAKRRDWSRHQTNDASKNDTR